MKIFINGYGVTDIPDKSHWEYSEKDDKFHAHVGYDIKTCKICDNPFWVVKDFKAETCGRESCKER